MKKLSIVFIVLLLSVNLFSQKAITLYPHKDALVSHIANPNDTSSQYKNYGSYSINRTLTWTNSGYAQTQRSLIDFDFSDLPENVHILSANLFFYGTGQHYTNITQVSSTYKSNASTVERILSPWDEDSVTWRYLVDSMTVTSSNADTLKNSRTKGENYDVDVTGLVRDMLRYPIESHGLLLSLIDEIPYTKMDFRSSDYTTESLRPKLELIYYDLDTYQIGQGTSVSVLDDDPYISPFGTYNDDNRHQYIYTAEELYSAGMSPGYIHSISYNVVSASVEMSNFKVNVGHTSLDAFSNSSFISGLTNVVSETFYPTTGWNEFVFDQNSFSWDGESNLVVEVCFDNETWDDNSTVRYSTLTQKRTASSYEDEGAGGCSISWSRNRNYGRPNIIFSAIDYSTDYVEPVALDNYSISLSSSQNYSRIVTTQEEGCLTSLLSETDPYKITEAISYTDGLGRTTQTQSIASSPSGKDIIQFTEYDKLGRSPKSYLPYVDIKSEMGKFRDSLVTYQTDFYDGTEDFGLSLSDVDPSDYPFEELVFDDSPSSAVLEQGATGASWQLGSNFNTYGHSDGNTVKTLWDPNTTYENKWEITSENEVYASQTSANKYQPGELIINTIVDENGNSTKNYYTKEGLLISSRRYNGASSLDTRYVYDELNRLRFVIPPAASYVTVFGDYTDIKSYYYASVLNKYAFCYTYDKKGRLTEKKLPGVDPVYYVYDKRNRLVMSQDGNLNDNNQWSFVKYDEIDRPIISGIVNENYSRSVMQDTVDRYTGNALFEEKFSEGTHGYTNKSYPDISSADVYAVNYYDDYDFVDGFSQDTLFAYHQLSSEYLSSSDLRVYGKPTGGKVRMIGEDTWLRSVIYYDKYGRVLSTARDLYPDGYEITNVKYKFNGQIEQSTLLHTPDDANLTMVKQRFEYDHRGRLLEQYHQIDSQDEVLLQAYSYNELGQLVEKNIYCPDSTEFLQSIDFEYNIRGWLKTINKGIPHGGDKDLFAQELQYEAPGDFNSDTLYNGMVSATTWWQAHNDTLSAYGFQYDDLYQLKSADFHTLDNSWSDSDDYNVSNITYDKNGNIETLNRDGSEGLIDDLDYAYTGNQLKAVGDLSADVSGRGDFLDGTNGYATTEYSYDSNGNMTKDDNKGITHITYNFLNLPETIEFTGGDKIIYTYDATGTRWKTAIEENGSINDSTVYMGGFIYNNDTLSFAQTATGRFVPEDNNFRYDHFLTDHLGSTRIVFTDLDDDGDADILQENHYYPFGMSMAARSYLSGQDNQQLYTGKRLDEQLGLDWYAHGARYYDPQLAVWHSPDPLSELYSSSSTYAYVINNPINFVDPDGMRRDPAPYRRDNYTSSLSDGYNRTPFENSFSFMRASGGWYYDNDTQTYSNFFGGSTMSAISFNNDIAPSFGGTLSSEATQAVIDGMNSLIESMSSISGNANMNRSWNLPLVMAFGFDNNIFQFDRESGSFYAPWTDIQVDPLAILVQSLSNSSNTSSLRIGGNGIEGEDFWVGATGTYFTTVGHYGQNAYWWKDGKGGLRSTRLLKTGANGKYVQGVQGLRNSYAIAGKAASLTKVAGTSLGAIGVGISVYDILQNGANVSNSMDAIMGGTAFIPVVGWIVSGSYFTASFISELATGYSISEHTQNWVSNW